MNTVVFEKLIPLRAAEQIPEFQKAFQSFSAQHDRVDWGRAWFDVKMHQMDEGECPCRPIWHYDGTVDPLNDNKVNYMIYLAGDCVCPTRFFETEPELSGFGDQGTIHKAARAIEPQYATFEIDYETCHWYTSQNLHTATFAQNSGTRLLIRAKFRD